MAPSLVKGLTKAEAEVSKYWRDKACLFGTAITIFLLVSHYLDNIEIYRLKQCIFYNVHVKCLYDKTKTWYIPRHKEN